MNKNGFFTGLIIVVVLLVAGFFWFISNWDFEDAETTCVPADCCHASECVFENEAQNCSEVLCSTNCESGTLDCGQGHCGIVDGECEVIWNE
jgi:hypothetical protein